LNQINIIINQQICTTQYESFFYADSSIVYRETSSERALVLRQRVIDGSIGPFLLINKAPHGVIVATNPSRWKQSFCQLLLQDYSRISLRIHRVYVCCPCTKPALCTFTAHPLHSTYSNGMHVRMCEIVTLQGNTVCTRIGVSITV
jgi:hypothetical protein